MKLREGRGKSRDKCFIYSITGRLTTILYAIIGCLIEKSNSIIGGLIKPSFMC